MIRTPVGLITPETKVIPRVWYASKTEDALTLSLALTFVPVLLAILVLGERFMEPLPEKDGEA